MSKNLCCKKESHSCESSQCLCECECCKSLKGKVAIITGSTSGIGLAIANELYNNGAQIVLHGFGEPQIIDEITAQMEAFYCNADLKSFKEIETMISRVKDKFGKIDILINNAGIQFVSPIKDFPDDKWNEILQVNLSSAFKLIKESIVHMSSGSRIINIASVHGLVASEFKSAYVAAKHGLIGLTKTVALEYASKDITCNAICPGFVKTPLIEEQINTLVKANNISKEEAEQEISLSKHPNKKFIQKEHIAKLASFLCKEEGNSCTGEIFSIDGGWTAH